MANDISFNKIRTASERSRPSTKPKPKPTKPRTVPNAYAPQGLGSWGPRNADGTGPMIVPVSDSNPFRGGDGTLGNYNNSFAARATGGGTVEQQLAGLLAEIAANGNQQVIKNNGGVVGGGNNGVVTGGAAGGQTGAYNPLTGETYSYQEQFGGSPTDISGYGYTPKGMVDMNQSGNYDVLVADMLAGMGITDPAMIKSLSEQAGFGALIDLIAGGDPNAPQSIGFIADYINQMMTPGGAVPTFDELVNMLVGTTGTSQASGLQASLTDSQINNYILDLLDSVGGNQYYQQATYGALDQRQREYNANKYKGGEGGSYSESLRQTGLYG